jgi:hypothetical protein
MFDIFVIFILTLNILNGDQSSLLLNTKIPLTPSLFGGHLVYNPLFLLLAPSSLIQKYPPNFCASRLSSRFGDLKLSSEHKKEKMYGFEDCFVE